MIELTIILLLTGFVINGASCAAVHLPDEQEIFGPVIENLDTTDLLFICDFSKNYQYTCNVTQQGVPFLKRLNKKIEAKKEATGDKSPKIAVSNVVGKWSDDDGLMKPSYTKADNLDIVAKCFFRTTYFECFGVPRCEERAIGQPPCFGGEPWRGSFQGAPNTGFRGNVTSIAMQQPGSAEQESADGRLIDPADFQDEIANATSSPGAAQVATAETLTNGSSTLNTGKMIIRQFENVDNETGVASKGAIAIIPDQGTVMVVNSQTFNRSGPNGGMTVGGSASAASRSQSSFRSQLADGNGNLFSFGEPGNVASASVSGSAMSPSTSNFPRQSLFPSWFQTGNQGFGSLFGNLFVPPPQTAVIAPASTSDASSNSSSVSADVTSDPCQNGQDFSSSLRCMVLDFQKTVTNNIFAKLTNSFSNFGGFGPMVQLQSMPVMQSRSDAAVPLGTSGNAQGQVMIQQQQQPSIFRSLFSSSGDDDWFRFRK